MKIYGLIGFPVKHSYSAIMHNAAFNALGIDARYELFEIKPQDLEEEFKKKISNGVLGLNVTIPYKEKIVELLDQLDPEAKLIGAVNTIKVNEDKTTTGFNTDGSGFITHLKQTVGFNPEGSKVSILGAGGAARALSIQLAKNNAASISLFDIDTHRTEALVAKLKANFPNCDIGLASDADGLLEKAPDLLINATPLGMHKEDRLVFNPELLHRNLIVYDLIYNPAQTLLLREAKAKGCRAAFNGLGMLLYQGAQAFKIWLDVEAPLEVMEEALRKVLTKV